MTAIEIIRSYDTDSEEHRIAVDGDIIATAHRVFVPKDIWSVKTGDKVYGIAPSEMIATGTLDKIAQAWAKNLRAKGLTVTVAAV